MSSTSAFTASCSYCSYPRWSEEDHTEQMQPHVLFVTVSNYLELQDSAEAAKCPGCRIIVEAWSMSEKAQVGRQLTYMRLKLASSIKYVSIECCYDQDSHNQVELDLFTLPGVSRLKGIRKANIIPHSTELAISMPQVKKWLSACLRDHRSCNQPKSFLPTRLLNLNYTEHDIRLVESSKIGSECGNLIYACLSHCWGDSRSPRLTTKENLEANMHGIPRKVLPKTFADAIDVAQALGIQYLWIDSLCVIQDSEEDWKAHVNTMLEVYQNAYITLAAGASKSDDGGFFRHSPRECIQTKPITLHQEKRPRNQCSPEITVHLRRMPDHPFRGMSARWPLSKRGWVLQEYLMSPRVIAFGPDEIFWSCKEAYSCSCSVSNEEFLAEDHRGGDLAIIEGLRQSLVLTPFSIIHYNTHGWWQMLMAMNSSLDLTFSKDILPAMTGLARLFKETGHTGEFLGGMWSNFLKRDLLWACCGHRLLDKPFQPSWSFIGLLNRNISVFWPQLEDTKAFEIADVNVKREAEHEWSLLRPESSLTIHGILLHVSLTISNRNNPPSGIRDAWPVFVFETFQMVDGRNDTSLDEIQMQRNLENTRQRIVKAGYGSIFWDYHLRQSQDECKESFGKAVAMLIGEDSLQKKRAWKGVCALLLKPVPQTDEGGHDQLPAYRRVGHIRWIIQGEYKNWPGKEIPKSTFRFV